MLSARISALDAIEYPKKNPQIKQILTIYTSAEELKKRDDSPIRKHDALWQENAEIQEKDLLNLYYAAVGNTDFRDWACNARGDILVFVESKGKDCVNTVLHVFKKKAHTFKRIGTYCFLSRYLKPEPQKLRIEDDGVTVVATWFDGKANTVSADYKFSFSSAQEIYYIFWDESHFPVLNGEIHSPGDQ